MVKLFLTLRYLRRRKIIHLSVAGIAVGILVLIVVTSVMGGFSRDMRERIRGVSSHLVIDQPGLYLSDYEKLLAEIGRVPGVAAAAPRVEGLASLFYGSRLGDNPVQFIGIDPAREIGGPGRPGASDLGAYLLDGQPPDFLAGGVPPPRPGLFIGCEMFGRYTPGEPFAEQWETVPLQTVKRTYGTVPVSLPDAEFCIVGRFRTKMAEYDSSLVYMPLKAAQEFLRIGDTVTHLAVRLDDPARAPAMAAAVRDALRASADPDVRRMANNRNFRVLTWEELPGKKDLLQAVEVEWAITVLLLFFIIMVAGFNIVAILALLVDLKTRDIGMLRSLGATTRDISGLFLLNGVVVGSLGALFGVPGGLLLAWTINPLERWIGELTGYHLFDPNIFLLDGIPTEVSYPTVAFVVAVTMAVSLAFSVHPARKAARLDPLEAIRYE
jgi:lipoprotein-releasing system permease protein